MEKKIYSVIQTEYKGCLFRSRLEARWAVFFDVMNIKWEYEPEGFNLNGTLYLPDFYLPNLKTYVEIKGEQPTEEEQNKCFMLSDATQKRVLLIHGLPYGESEGDFLNETDGLNFIMFAPKVWDTSYLFCECPTCHKIGLEWFGRVERMSCGCYSEYEKVFGYFSQKLQYAYKIARSFRFGGNNVR